MKNLRGESTRQYICEVKSSAADAEKLLSQIAGATELTVTQESSWARVVMSSADAKTDLREAIYNAVRDKGWSMRLLETKVASLEDVFVNITAK